MVVQGRQSRSAGLCIVRSDPGKAPFEDVVSVAKTLQRELRRESVNSFVNTSGKSGLHIMVPWKESGNYEEAREWALRFAERIV